MRLGECLVVGSDQPVLPLKQKVSEWIPFVMKGRLRNETGRGTVVRIGIVEPVRVELDLAVVEVEVRSVIEANIGIRNLPLLIQSTRA